MSQAPVKIYKTSMIITQNIILNNNSSVSK